MRAHEFITEAVKQRLDAKCWKGKHKEGTKIKGGVRVNNCVPNESVAEEISSDERQKTYNHVYQIMIRQAPEFMYRANSEDVEKAILKAISFGKQISPHDLASYAYGMLKSGDINEQGMSEGLTLYQQCNMIGETAAWKRKEGKSKSGGLNAKGVASYRKENPGSKLQTAVTTKPSKLKPGSKDAKRRKSFCARMGGMKGPMKKDNGEPTRKALALKKWNCESVEHFVEMFVENMDHSKDNQAVPELKAALIARKEKLQSATEDQVYDIIDSIMTRIAKSHGISGQKLHDMWVKEYDQIPDTWIMN